MSSTSRYNHGMATEPPKRKRRWFRFSLKTFVVVLTVFCVWLGLLVHRVNKQKEAVQWVKDMPDSRDKRRWYQFSLRTLMIAVFLMCLPEELKDRVQRE